MFATRDCRPLSRNTFRTRAWIPAVKPAESTSTCATPKPPGYPPAARASIPHGPDGTSQIQTTQNCLHTLPDTDQRNLDAFTYIADSCQAGRRVADARAQDNDL